MKGIKKALDKTSFSKSTLRGVIRKGFISRDEIDKTSLTEYTKKALEKIDFNLIFIRDKQVIFCIDSEKKIIYDCKSSLGSYLDYFIEKNQEYKIEVLENMHPENLRARGLSVEKIAEANGFSL